VCELALSVGGGASFYRTQPIEQCFRDVQGLRYHPLSPDESLVHAGKVALGLPADDR
jgi:acyl-CoA dehydrogenase